MVQSMTESVMHVVPNFPCHNYSDASSVIDSIILQIYTIDYRFDGL